MTPEDRERDLNLAVAKALGWTNAYAACPECGSPVNEGLLYPGIGCTKPCGWKRPYSEGVRLVPDWCGDLGAAMGLLDAWCAEADGNYWTGGGGLDWASVNLYRKRSDFTSASVYAGRGDAPKLSRAIVEAWLAAHAQEEGKMQA